MYCIIYVFLFYFFVINYSIYKFQKRDFTTSSAIAQLLLDPPLISCKVIALL